MRRNLQRRSRTKRTQYLSPGLLGSPIGEGTEARALRLNSQYAKSLGWAKYRGLIETYLSRFWVASMWPEADFARAVARWQKAQNLAPDGVIGPDSWKRMKVMLCLGYEPGEAAKSRTQTGHLKQDVFMTKAGWLVIADFAVGRSDVKAATRGENLLSDWLRRFEAEPPDEILIVGFSDCVGEENNNERLRMSRALEVFKLFGPKSRVKARVFSGKMGKYLADDNLTAINRAMNRGVLIQWKRDVEFKPETVIGDGARLMANLIRCATLAADGIPGEPGKRIRKMISIANRIGYPRNLQLWFYNPEPMVRYFNWRITNDKARGVMTSDTGGKMPFDGYAHPGPGQWRVFPFQTMAKQYGARDISSCAPEIRQYLLVMDDQIEMSFRGVNQIINSLALGGGIMLKGAQPFLQHLNDLRGTPDHLYSAFK